MPANNGKTDGPERRAFYKVQMKKNNFPVVEIEGLEMAQNDFVRGDSRWNCLKLIEHSKKYQTFDMPLACVDLSSCPWNDDKSVGNFVYHMKRVEVTDLKYPVLLDDQGGICDGWHRICKAVLKGDTTIKAIRLSTMPEVD